MNLKVKKVAVAHKDDILITGLILADEGELIFCKGIDGSVSVSDKNARTTYDIDISNASSYGSCPLTLRWSQTEVENYTLEFIAKRDYELFKKGV